ncbi:hypothetical protein [Cohnella herbarum]|uniref:Uncharacterized protein n=1 Tax=Cohnella herbarum TaxID=2728023 RepID=A0A7Z2VRU5_9BACL|nr:hypothetical protein [Cohnella herbarum]QJD87887.1 hypothetical protein HH215_34985 [Cohnella herbarum]
MTNKGAIAMNNQFTLWYEPSKANEVRGVVRENVKRKYGFSESEFVSIGGGFKFLFDDETNGEIAITFEEDKNGFRVTVAGTWSYEVIDVYHNTLPFSAD